MDIDGIENIIKKFRWNLVRKMIGCAHESVIGFIATEWLALSENNFILDGAPELRTESGRRHADLILGSDSKNRLVVEVESGASKYIEKLRNLNGYLADSKRFLGLEAGMIVLTNGYDVPTVMDVRKYDWNRLKEEILKKGMNIVLVSFVKKKASLDDSPFGRLRRSNTYYPWNIVGIEYWIHLNNETREGILLKNE